ncbi:F-box only protein 21 isoform X1 [Papilio machaon]|uniref:F-box only protein 21 isoform X1 n=1 Tax=Papilio machaon TaxID=76193 RepID=UPI001E662E61|nr:F-box only protein 21 isoform X1 [Papilio machaon]
MENPITIFTLPDELIFIVLKYNDIRDAINFSATCRHFHDLVKSNQSFWAYKFKRELPCVFEVADQYGSGIWLNELKTFLLQKQSIYKELLELSPRHYWKVGQFSLKDVVHFFKVSSTNNLGYYYTISILHNIIRTGYKNMVQYDTAKPYTLTEMHYAKCVLSHIIHCYLTVKWIKSQMIQETPPEIVLNFIVQWIDNENFHFFDDVENKLQIWADKVKVYLKNTHQDELTGSTDNEYTPAQIFSAVSTVLFNQNRMTMTTSANLDTLDVVKVLNNKVGNQIAVYAIYQAIASRCGAECELIVFVNHLFLEWRCYDNPRQPTIYKIQILTGELEANHRCPYVSSRFKYSADALLHSLHACFVKSLGPMQNWASANAADLLGFLGGTYTTPSAYDIFYQFFSGDIDLISLNSTLDIKNLSERELAIILSLVHVKIRMNRPLGKFQNKAVKISEAKQHDATVQYAVGMVCSHKDLEYLCIIHGWELSCNAEWRTRLTNDGQTTGFEQPYYNVVANDQTERYVAQENLVPVNRPNRLLHLEDLISKEFSHFDGFCYVMNEEKKKEYPEEGPIIEEHRKRCMTIENY